MVDHLYLDAISFPIRRGELYAGRDTANIYRWGIEINCGESPQLDYRSWPDAREPQSLDWLAGTEPILYAQMLPLRVTSPDELVGRVYSFPQSPDDDPPDWPRGIGWPFFCLYLMEHDLVHPVQVAITEKRGRQYRVEITGGIPTAVGRSMTCVQPHGWTGQGPNQRLQRTPPEAAVPLSRSLGKGGRRRMDAETQKLLVQLCQMFLVPATILINALAHADNERLKTGVSSLGLLMSLIWWGSAGQLYAGLADGVRGFGSTWWLSAHALPFVFVAAWAVSVWIHASRWRRLAGSA